MKRLLWIKKGHLSALLLLFLSASFSYAQIKNDLTNEQKKLLINSWYESPQELKGNIITFRAEKHQFVSGVDLVGYENSEIIIKKNQEFSVALWKWCSGDNDARVGKWTLNADNSVALNFSTNTCNCEMKIIEIEKNILKVEVKRIK